MKALELFSVSSVGEALSMHNNPASLRNDLRFGPGRCRGPWSDSVLMSDRPRTNLQVRVDHATREQDLLGGLIIDDEDERSIGHKLRWRQPTVW